MEDARPQTRIQRKNRETILAAALDVFAAEGFRGATLDQIAERAGLSKPNVLYYFASKEALHETLLEGQLETWLKPLGAIDASGEPVEEILAYVSRKLEMSRMMPRESRLFANEILRGAPQLESLLGGELARLVARVEAILLGWAAEGRIAALPPRHLIFSIWATTQHYADFEAQVDTLLDQPREAQFDDAADFLASFYRRALAPD